MTLRRSLRNGAVKTAGDIDTLPSKRKPQTDERGTQSAKKSRKAIQEPTETVFKVPSTPKRKRTTKDREPPPITPTPSLVGFIAAPYSTGDIDDGTPPPLDRPVEPHHAAATLVTPKGSRAVAYPKGVSPSKTGLPQPSATTGDLLEQACKHLVQVEPRLKSLVEKHHCRIFSPDGLAEEIDPFRSLVSGIMAQQVSGAAAKSIKNKFIALFRDGNDVPAASFPTPAEVARTDIARLREAGLSQRKAEYIQGLAEKFAAGELSTQMLLKASDEDVMEKLIAVRGLGKWSVEMFACFALKRPNIFSTGDLGVQRGMAAFMGKDVAKLKAKGGGKWKYMSEEDMLKHSEKFAPYRSVFMWYMWRVEDVDVDALQNST